jgi:ABC-type uncharacterized transport system auxiliary subunit
MMLVRPGLRQPRSRCGWCVLLVLAACGGGSEPEQVYSFPAFEQPPPLDEPALKGTLVIDPLVTDSIYSDQRMAWRDMREPWRVQQLDNHLWSLAPPQLVQDRLLSCLSARRAADSVVPPGVPVEFDLILNGQIERFEMQLDGEAAAVSVAVELFLTRRQPRELVWQRGFRYQVPLAEVSAEAAVGGFRTALERLCKDVAGTVEHSG